ncbi:MAG: hypothetical protein ACTS8H_02125 [Arsenophonus sp. NC-PE1-MAG3]
MAPIIIPISTLFIDDAVASSRSRSRFSYEKRFLPLNDLLASYVNS